MLDSPRRCGRYWMYGEIASGGMASVHFGRMVGARGFALTVAIKRLRREMASDPAIAAMFVNEARLAARIRHPNVVPTLDVIEERGELFVVMEYVQGESLSRLMAASFAARERPPLPVVARILCDALEGLHAAHEAKSEAGEPLDIVHRDVSPQNIMLGTDGVARVVDFGIAKAANHGPTTKEGEVKGKIRYLSPEQLDPDADVDRRVDVFASGIVLWELVTGTQLRASGGSVPELVGMISRNRIDPPSARGAKVPPELEAIVMRALQTEPMNRFPYARDMANAIAAVVPPAPYAVVAEWMKSLAQPKLTERAAYVQSMESASLPSEPTPEPTSSTVTKTEIVKTPRRKWWLAALLVPVLLIAGALVTRRGAESAPALHASASAAVASSQAPVVASSVVVVAAPPPPPPPASTAQPTSRPRNTWRVPASHAPDCRIPYVVDATGVRVPRPECM